MPIASDTMAGGPHYRRECFLAGLKHCGFEVDATPLQAPTPRDVLLVWNRSPRNDLLAKRYEAAGARVVVVENGYIGADTTGRQHYAMALGHHCGAGTWNEGPEDRWSRLGVELRPWRRSGTEIVVMPQRGIGPTGVRMPTGWTEDVARRLRKITDRPVRIRPHPGKERPDPRADLSRAHAVVIWASGAGIKSLVYGVPVFHEFPLWIGAAASRANIGSIETPLYGDRLPMLRRLAWAQWSLDEITSGEAFACLLGSR